MGSISTCEHPDSQKPLINTTKRTLSTSHVTHSNQRNQSLLYNNNKRIDNSMNTRSTNNALMIELIKNDIITEDNLEFDKELFYCWVTGDISNEHKWIFNLNLHIAQPTDSDGFLQSYYKLENITYSKINEIYSYAYGNREKHFPQTGFPPTLLSENNKRNEKLKEMQKYMLLDKMQWNNTHNIATEDDLTKICDLLITCFNCLSLVQQYDIFKILSIHFKVRQLLQTVSDEWINHLTVIAKQCINSDTNKPYLDEEFMDLEFDALSLVERPNDITSTHWALTFEGDEWLLSLDWFDKDVVYHQLLPNNALGQRISWYSWIGQLEFIENWSERIRIPLDKAVRYYDIRRLVYRWKKCNRHYQVFDNNCQHFARDILSVFQPNAAKKLDKFRNLFVSATMTLEQEIQRIDKISAILQEELDHSATKIIRDEVEEWLMDQVGLSKYCTVFKSEGFVRLSMLKELTEDILKEMIDDKQDRQKVMQHIKQLRVKKMDRNVAVKKQHKNPLIGGDMKEEEEEEKYDESSGHEPASTGDNNKQKKMDGIQCIVETNDIKKWFDDILKLPYYENFVDDGWDEFDTIIEITDDDLQKMDIGKKGHRIKIMKSVKKIKENCNVD